MSRPLRLVLNMLRAWIRMLRTQRQSLPVLAKIGLAVLMLPAFGILLILLRTLAAIRKAGPIAVEAQTDWGGRFIVHPPDLIGLYLWLFDVWEPDLTAFIQRRLAAGDEFVDVGANLGYDSVLAATCVGSSGRVIAIEASGPVFSILQRNLALNQVSSRVRTINKAAAAESGTINVFSGPAHNVGLTTTVSTRGFPVQSAIEALPLDDLLSSDEIRAARLVKIDVEGAEPGVLAGMRRFLANCRNDVEILIELSPNWWSDQTKTPEDVLRHFLQAGFHMYQINNSYWPWRYLWPRCVSKPKRVRDALTQRVDRIDLVLSRQDSSEL